MIPPGCARAVVFTGSSADFGSPRGSASESGTFHPIVGGRPIASPTRLGDIGSAITEVLQLLPVVILMIGVGLFFIPVFMVVIPVMVRDFYAGSSVELAMVNGAFVLSTITNRS